MVLALPSTGRKPRQKWTSTIRNGRRPPLQRPERVKANGAVSVSHQIKRIISPQEEAGQTLHYYLQSSRQGRGSYQLCYSCQNCHTIVLHHQGRDITRGIPSDVRRRAVVFVRGSSGCCGLFVAVSFTHRCEGLLKST